MSRCARGTRGAGVTSKSWPMRDASIRRTPRMEAPRTPTTGAAYRRPAPRPAYSVLGHDAWAASGIPPIGDWRDALRRAFPAILAEDAQTRRNRASR
jgi:hypothetical protein